MLIGRTQALTQIRAWLARRQHVLLVGPVGVGKSALLREAVEGLGSVVTVPSLQPLKPALLALAQQLHAQERLALPDIDSQYLDWSEVQSQVSSLPTAQLIKSLVPLAAGMTLVVDELDGITPSLARSIEPLFEALLVVGAIMTVDLTPELQRFFWHFHLLPLEPLGRDEGRQLLWSQVDPLRIPDREAFERHVWEVAGGNPLAIRELARQTPRVELKPPDPFRQLHHEAGIQYLDLTPGLLLLGAVAVIMRFLALGLNDIEGYILAGSFGAVFLTARYFLYRTLRKTS